MKRVLTEEAITREHAAGRRTLVALPADCVVTPAAWSRARELGVRIEVTRAAPSSATRSAATATPPGPSFVSDGPSNDTGGAAREVDGSGAIVVRGDSVRLGHFAGAGPGKRVGLTDLITAKDGAPMAAGIMSWRHEDSFPWSLDYHEVDLVLEGELHVEIAGRTLRARAGDVVYLPRGSRVVFGTPSSVKVFYVTYPADWNGAASAMPRPVK